MRRVTHMLSGVAAGAVVTSLFGLESFDLYFVGAFFGILPDFDILFSGFGRSVHRSPASHSLIASLAATAIWVLLLCAIRDVSSLQMLCRIPISASALAAFCASFLHVLEDSLTRQGCRALYPFSRRTFRGPVRYDDIAANAALNVVALAGILVALKMDLHSSV